LMVFEIIRKVLNDPDKHKIVNGKRKQKACEHSLEHYKIFFDTTVEAGQLRSELWTKHQMGRIVVKNHSHMRHQFVNQIKSFMLSMKEGQHT
ncbi:MAG: hypothetical protein ACREOZ_01515, partial [Gloeomargaritales cyanobacterium]